MHKQKITVRNMCMISVLVAVTSLLAQISIPMPLGVPMTMQTFAVCLCGILLGPRDGTIAILIYLLLGAAGAPVFSEFSGGLQRLIGPTGGFLLSFPFMAFLAGIGTKFMRHRGAFAGGLIAGVIVNFLAGALMYSAVMHTTFWQALLACVIPFLPVTVIKTIAAGWVGIQLRQRLFSY